jgi:hypothetical protein
VSIPTDLAYGEVFCQDAPFWQHITGWEAVVAIVFVVTAWTIVNVARFHYMVKIGEVKGAATTPAAPANGDKAP